MLWIISTSYFAYSVIKSMNAIGKKMQHLLKEFFYKTVLPKKRMGEVLFRDMSVQRDKNRKHQRVLYLRKGEL